MGRCSCTFKTAHAAAAATYVIICGLDLKKNNRACMPLDRSKNSKT